MGLAFYDLDDHTRDYMIREINADVTANALFPAPYLTRRGRTAWPDCLLEAAKDGSDETLAARLWRERSLDSVTMRLLPNGRSILAPVPEHATETLADSAFNHYYARALSRRAIDQRIGHLEVYWARSVPTPRPEDELKIGLLYPPQTVLAELEKAPRLEAALGIAPGPVSGLSLRIPR